ncbi:hypothetical protein [Thermomonas paludicola]|uniref:hypothetical protein n=1 Tax=Thermomonas paludicola TaxID=2884874 RepID=UPI002113DF4E|nr:hypothetical protein [Thermomonas paludicola]
MKNLWLLIGCLVLAISLGLAEPLVAHKIEIAQWGGGPLVQIYAPIQAPKIFALRAVTNLYWLIPGIIFGLFSERPPIQRGLQLGLAFSIAAITISFVHTGFPRYTASHFLAPTLTDDLLRFLETLFLFQLSTAFGSVLRHHRYAPNNSFKPTPLRSGNGVAG